MLHTGTETSFSDSTKVTQNQGPQLNPTYNTAVYTNNQQDLPKISTVTTPPQSGTSQSGPPSYRQDIGWSTRKQYIRTGRTSLRAILYLIIIIGTLYLVAYITYLILVPYKFTFLHGFPRPDLAPGPFVSDRYNYQWFLLLFDCARIITVLLLLWTIRSPLTAGWRRDLHRVIVQLFLILDVLISITLFIKWCFMCNNPVFPTSLCNDKNYCAAFASDHPDRCLPLIGPPLDACDLSPDPGFLAWLIFTSLFTVFDIIQLIVIDRYEFYVRKYINNIPDWALSGWNFFRSPGAVGGMTISSQINEE